MIVLDGIVFALQRHGGISTYFRELAARVLATQRDAELWTYGERGTPQEGPRVVRRSSRLLERYRDPAVVPRGVILHSSYYRTSPAARANVITVYDFMYERYSRGPRRMVHSRQKGNAIRRADALICISASTKKDLLERYPGIPDTRIHVIHLAAGPEFHPLAGRQPAAEPYALFVGTRSGYKNFTAAARGVATIPRMRLVCAGGGGFTGSERALLARILPDRFEHAGHVDRLRLNELYNGAHALLYTSRFEGFGIPIVEAMAAGCPVVTTRAGSMMEVAGNAAMLLDEPDDVSIARALHDLGDPATRGRLVALGQQRAAEFSWDTTAEKTLAVYSALE